MPWHGHKTNQPNSSGHVTCAVFFNKHSPSAHSAQEEDQGVKELLEARQTGLTKERKATVIKKVSMATNGKLTQPKMESQTKVKGKRCLTNGNSRTLQTSGSMNKEPRMVETALAGNQMQYTKDSSIVNKPNKFMGSHRPTKETRV